MGLFDAFKKKNCDICGGEIGLLGNRKLEDGNMCKNCAKKLSPWFDERRHSTIAQINDQLAYREANKEKVAAFRTTRVFGESTKVYLDEDAGVFLVSDDRESLWDETNPDVIAFADVTGVDVDVDEDRTELQRENAEGEMVSYNPPRYTYSYDFELVINVRNPYFSEMRFRLNDSSVEIESFGSGFRAPGPARLANRGSAGFSPENNAEYARYVKLGEEIKEALLNVRQQARDASAAAAAPKQAATCPWCGATTTPDANGCCEYCGGAVNS